MGFENSLSSSSHTSNSATIMSKAKKSNKPIPALCTPLTMQQRTHRSDSLESSTAGSPISSTGTSPSSTSSPYSFFSKMRSRRSSSSRLASPSSSRFTHSLSSFLLRRKPSRADLDMCAERDRCCENEIERRGVELMEPRPVDLEPTTFFANSSHSTLANSSMENLDPGVNIDAMLDTDLDGYAFNGRQFARIPRCPPCVMGGIFETMEQGR